jgi:hypothetical protein
MTPARGRDRLGRPVAWNDPAVRDHGIEVEAERDGPATIAAAQDLLDRSFPFAAHEVFETRWKSCPDDERDLWQGLAQWCVALTHAERGNEIGAEALRQRAAEHLATSDAHTAAHRYGVDIDAISAWLVAPSDLPRVLVTDAG